MNECGGIRKTNIITFQTQVMMGAQFTKLKEAQAKAEEDNKLDEACKILIVACLRVAWNDAFRHVTKNVENLENKFKKNGEFSDTSFDRYVCEEILNDDLIINTFKKYINAETTEKKITVLCDADKERKLAKKFETIKIIDETNDKALCFGHFQKLFNMAVKLYICLYIMQDELGLNFMSESTKYADPKNFANADCPVDRYILQRLDEIISEENISVPYKELKERRPDYKKFADISWSKLKSEDDMKVYEVIQNTIKELCNSNECNLIFDFKNWKTNN